MRCILQATETVVGVQTLLQRHLEEVSHGMFIVTVDMTQDTVSTVCLCTC